MTKIAILTSLIASIAAMCCAQEAKPLEESATDFTDLSIEELLEVDVISTNVLGAHTHFEDEWMLGYMYMLMNMEGNRDGTNRISNSDVLKIFPVTPTKMTMEMHMFMLMYAPSDDLTLNIMLPYLRLSMDHITRKNVQFTTSTEGIGDTEISGLYTVSRINEYRHRLLLKLGLMIPTGSIDEKGDTPAGKNQKLPYPMQLGSGTFDPIGGIVYLSELENWASGAEAIATIRTGKNSNDYRLGNKYDFGAWGARKWTNWLSATAGLDGQIWENISGADPDLDPKVVPTADPNRRAGKRIDAFLVLNFYVPKGRFKDNRLAIQYGVPVYQDLDGPQLETDWLLSAGWQWTFTF